MSNPCPLFDCNLGDDRMRATAAAAAIAAAQLTEAVTMKHVPRAKFSLLADRLFSAFSFRDDDVPLGSELSLEFDGQPVDVRVANGHVQGLSIRVDGCERSSGGNIATVELESVGEAPGDRTRYVVRLAGSVAGTVAGSAGAGSGGASPCVRAEVPPRYFGLRIVTGGDVDISAGIREARDVSIHTQGGTITSTASITTEGLRLSSGGGSIHAAQVMANNAVVDADSLADAPEENRARGAVHVGRASCLHFDCRGGEVRIESLISSAADVRGSTIEVDNANTLDGAAALCLRGAPSGGSRSPSLRLGGVDGSIVLDDDGRGSEIEVQLNSSARQIEFRTCEATTVACFKPAELRLVVGDEEEAGGGDLCRVVGGEGKRVTVVDRSWRERFEEKYRRPSWPPTTSMPTSNPSG